MPRPRQDGYVVSDSGKSKLRTYNISVGNRRTTIKLAPEIYGAIEKIAEIEQCSPKDVFEFIAQKKEDHPALATAVSVFVIDYFMQAATQEGHSKAGHGSLIAPTRMSAEDLVRIGQLLYGGQWKSELSRNLGVSRITVTRWAEGTHKVPKAICEDIHRLAADRHSAIEKVLTPPTGIE